MSAIGVLMMAYGGPDRLEDVGPYLLDVRGRRPTPPEVVEEVRSRYQRIGGRSPILERTTAQAAALARALDNGVGRFEVVVGMRHWRPYIRDALGGLAERGVTRAVGLVMAPHYSRMSVGAYYTRVTESSAPVEIAPIEQWHLLPGYVEALADRVRAGLNRFRASERDAVPVIFTAHSLPQRILTWHDPYPEQLRATVDAVMALVGAHPHVFAYQSAAMTPEPWLGPAVSEVLEQEANRGVPGVLVAPIGFLCEHVEVLFDLDLELRERAQARGVRLERIEMLNVAPPLIAGLAELVRARAREAGWL